MSRKIGFMVAAAAIVIIGFPTVALTLAQPPVAQPPVAQPPVAQPPVAQPAVAQPPSDSGATLELPDLPDLEFPAGDRAPNPKVQKIIRDALETGGHAETGDPVLDEILQVIRSRRSVLDGSPLDPDAEIGSAADGGPAESKSARAHAAESLLKAARRLERIEPADKTRRELVNQMRQESVRLLTE